MNPGRPASFLANRQPGWKLATTALLLAATVSIHGTGASASSTAAGAPFVLLAQNVDYISAGSGAALDLGFPVLVPSWVPAPFGGEPAIDAGGGAYGLYWMNGGAEPTFLQVTGVVGGGLPAGSPYDLNVQLSINASVNGYGAIHDITPIYDTVWWIQGGVLYTVTSRNMTGTDSLSLANSLVTFVAPAAEEPEPTNPPPTEAQPDPIETTDPGTDDGGGGSSDGETSSDEPDTTSEDTTVDDGSSSQDDTGTATETSTDSPDTAPGDVETPQSAGSDGTGAANVASDGTGGPPVEVVQTDGTGGSEGVIVIPRKTPVLAPTP